MSFGRISGPLGLISKAIEIFATDYQMPLSQDDFTPKKSSVISCKVSKMSNSKNTICPERPCNNYCCGCYCSFFLLYSSVARKHFWKARLSFCNGDYWRHALLFAKWESKVERPFFIQPLKAPPPIDNMMVLVRNQI